MYEFLCTANVTSLTLSVNSSYSELKLHIEMTLERLNISSNVNYSQHSVFKRLVKATEASL